MVLGGFEMDRETWKEKYPFICKVQTTNPILHPSTVGMGKQEGKTGSGIVVGKYVITAAHTLFAPGGRPIPPEQMHVELATDPTICGTVFDWIIGQTLRAIFHIPGKVEKCVVHPHFRGQNGKSGHGVGDLAILTLREPLTTSGPKVVFRSNGHSPGTLLQLMGFGKRYQGDKLMSATPQLNSDRPVEVRSDDEFLRSGSERLVPIDEDPKPDGLLGHCPAGKGDSGGPLFYWKDDKKKAVIAGLVWGGDGSGEESISDFMVRLSHHRAWIDEHTDGELRWERAEQGVLDEGYSETGLLWWKEWAACQYRSIVTGAVVLLIVLIYASYKLARYVWKTQWSYQTQVKAKRGAEDLSNLSNSIQANLVFGVMFVFIGFALRAAIEKRAKGARTQRTKCSSLELLSMSSF